jgi:hypothetical protein
MIVLLMIVAILGAAGQPNPTVGNALNVTEIGTFDDLAKCKAAIASAYVERKTASPGPPGPLNISLCVLNVARAKIDKIGSPDRM